MGGLVSAGHLQRVLAHGGQEPQDQLGALGFPGAALPAEERKSTSVRLTSSVREMASAPAVMMTFDLWLKT